jgi:hypothetical protein
MRRMFVSVVALAAVLHGQGWAAPAAGIEATQQQAAPRQAEPIVFDGLGLENFKGSGSIAGALRGIEADAQSPELPLGVPVDVVVRGPSGRGSGGDRLAAELKSRIEGVDFTAGMQADSTMIEDGPAKWVGGVGVSSDHDQGREVLELKTSLGRSQQVGMLGVEVGPRIERRLRGGTVFFLDGKAQAHARRSAETGSWMMPGLAERGQDGGSGVGVAASTGLVR